MEIPSITFDDLPKYLGVYITPTGNVQLPRQTWEDYLQNIIKSHLNPIQKVQAIRQVVTVKIQYHLRLSDHGLEEARKINRLVHKYVKKILHLLTWTSNAWIHHREGCNITDLVVSIAISRSTASNKMKMSQDKISQSIGDKLEPTNTERLVRLGLQSIDNKKEEMMKRRAKTLEQQNNGRTLITMLSSKQKRSWLWSQRGRMPRNKIRIIQILSGTLPNKVNKTRGIPNIELKKCNRCNNNKIEVDAYLLPAGTMNQGLISKRHDYVVNKIAKELKKNHPQAKVFRERGWRSGTELLRTDITLIEVSQTKITEVTIPYEINNSDLTQRRMDKNRKYEWLTQPTELSQVECLEGEVIPIVIGTIGTMNQETVNDLNKLKLETQKDPLQMTVVKGSIDILNAHFKRHDFNIIEAG